MSKPPLHIDTQHNPPHAFMDLLTAEIITFHLVADSDERGFHDFFNRFHITDNGLVPKVERAGFHSGESSRKGGRR